ncbi:Lipase_3 domain-containing protein/Lipase3_N domain-containing protein [Cephalotus follicularis]|uniref:Lipase_3 domain-containing protein/Lipase3_N domain-containing protein n=1 Tax=Cephalotus follicularis TaxID=3775 RepID=A0A1Q3C9F0_CEPFO|nr:Lipase_3 domain-containing protein/Lipase3_N domain-containing protein [Cephalotus follicularis]
MSLCCGVDTLLALGCMRWAWKRCTYVGSNDSESWILATPDEFEPIPRICRLILAVYETDLHNPHFSPPGGYRINPDYIVKRVTYEQTQGHAPPYLIYIDHDNKEIVLAIRGLNLVKESDYKLLLDNRLGKQMFDGGYVHHGLLKSALWLLNEESGTLRRLWVETGRGYNMVFAGHSLGSGVAALLTVIVVNHRDKLGGIPRENVRCYAVAPARCMSLNLAVKYADVIHSVVLQDDFLPRTPTPLEDIFKSIFCLPCLLSLVCLRDTFIPEGRKLRDLRRLYAPGRMYHIVERKFCRCGRFPPEVRTAIPVDGRFEHIVLSCNATSDHAIVWIEREAEKALERMKESSSETVTKPPKIQELERKQTIEKEHKDAMERAVSLNIPHAVTSPEAEIQEDEAATADAAKEAGPSQGEGKDASETKSKSSSRSTNWDEVVKKLFDKSDSGGLVLKNDIDAPE